MKEAINLVKRLIKHELIAGAGFLFVASLFGSVFNFFFNLFMSRSLSVSDYGVLASLISIITLSMVVAGAVVPTIIRFAGSYFAKEELHMVRGLFFNVGRFSFSLGIFVFFIFLIFWQRIGGFFNINDKHLIILVGFVVFLIFIGVINGALLQAKLAFRFIALTNLLSTFLKLFLGITLVFLGFSVIGALWAILLASLIPYLLSFIPLRFILKKHVSAPKIQIGTLLAYGAPAAIASFSLMSLITTDIILVKHFFDPSRAGIYAGLSLIGRVIFFFSAPVGAVMFPLVVQKHTRKEDYQSILKLSVLLILLPSIALTIFYFIFPEFTIRFFLKNEEYISAALYLGFFGIFVGLFSLLSVFTNFYLSIKKTNIFIPLVTGAIIQAALIWIWHESFWQIIIISTITTFLLLISFIIYYPFAIKTQKQV